MVLWKKNRDSWQHGHHSQGFIKIRDKKAEESYDWSGGRLQYFRPQPPQMRHPLISEGKSSSLYTRRRYRTQYGSGDQLQFHVFFLFLAAVLYKSHFSVLLLIVNLTITGEFDMWQISFAGLNQHWFEIHTLRTADISHIIVIIRIVKIIIIY